MKTTVKTFQANAELRRNLNNSAENTMHTDLELSLALKNEANKIDEEYFNLLDTVSVSFYIGYRKYYEDVTKIGKTYFSRTTKMTKSNGYRDIKEIGVITDRMKSDMIDDMYYY